MDTIACFLDEATQTQLVSEMGQVRFADVSAAVNHLAYLAKSGKRFSAGDVITILTSVGLSTDEVPAALADLTRRRILDSYLKQGTVVYFMQRAARIEYGESIGHRYRVSPWSCFESDVGDMSDQFDPYYAWLAIPPKDQPPNYYRLLGVELFESTAKVIQTAAEQRTVYLRTFQIGKHSAESQKLLGEVATAKICLLNTEKKAAYDQRLRQELQTSATQASGSKSAGLDSSVPGAAKPLERDSLSAAGPGLGKKPRPKPVVLIGGAVLAVVAIGSAALWWGLRGRARQAAPRLMEGEERPLAEPGINSPPESPQPAAENVPAVDVANSKEEPETQPAPSEPPKTESPKSEAKVTAESPQAATERPGTASTNQSKKSGGKKRRAVATKNPATVSANATNPPLSAHTSDMRTPVPSETAQAEAIQSPISSEGKEPSSKVHEPALAGYFQVVWVQVKTKNEWPKSGNFVRTTRFGRQTARLPRARPKVRTSSFPSRTGPLAR